MKNRKLDDAAMAGPAVMANRFVVMVGSNVRIAFLEQNAPKEPANFRAAVAMSYDDAKELRDLLKKMLAP